MGEALVPHADIVDKSRCLPPAGTNRSCIWRGKHIYLYIYYIYAHTYIYEYVCMYIYRERESVEQVMRLAPRERRRCLPPDSAKHGNQKRNECGARAVEAVVPCAMAAEIVERSRVLPPAPAI